VDDGEVTVWSWLGTSLEAIAAWAAGYELTEVGASAVRLGHVFRLPAVEVTALDGDVALVRFPRLADAAAIAGYLDANHLRLVRWVRDLDDGGLAARDRLAVVALPRLEMEFRPLGGGLCAAALPAGLSEAEVQPARRPIDAARSLSGKPRRQHRLSGPVVRPLSELSVDWASRTDYNTSVRRWLTLPTELDLSHEPARTAAAG
jgi:hypothetical protein